MKASIATLLQSAVNQYVLALGIEPGVDVHVSATKNDDHGHYASNVALMLAKSAKCAPREVAQALVSLLPNSPLLTRVEIAGPGFLNFSLSEAALAQVVLNVLSEKSQYGLGQSKDTKIHLEFVSANPTGPLHVGHGRSAAFGASLANVLQAGGYEVYREYYVNDAGRQMDILALSLILRYLALFGHECPFPDNAYQGDYVTDIAKLLKDDSDDKYVFDELVSSCMSQGPCREADKEAYLDAYIHDLKAQLGDDFWLLKRFVLSHIRDDIKDDLSEFGVEFDHWYSEQSLLDSGAVERCKAALIDRNYLYEKDGAWWFRSTEFGDEKDRVFLRSNGQATYFAHDAAYHFDKYERGFDIVADIFGADHHGYMSRIRASMDALGHKVDQFKIFLVQFAILYRGTEKVQMSTRSGSFVTLRTLREEVGNDAARFLYVLRKPDAHMDFDLELAKKQSNDNPVYYVQYAHARICSVMNQLKEKALSFTQASTVEDLAGLRNPQAHKLMLLLARYPERLEGASNSYAPHYVAQYVCDLAAAFHGFYNACPFLVENEADRNARLSLSLATKQVLQNGLSLLNVSAPESM